MSIYITASNIFKGCHYVIGGWFGNKKSQAFIQKVVEDHHGCCSTYKVTNDITAVIVGDETEQNKWENQPKCKNANAMDIDILCEAYLWDCIKKQHLLTHKIYIKKWEKRQSEKTPSSSSRRKKRSKRSRPNDKDIRDKKIAKTKHSHQPKGLCL